MDDPTSNELRELDTAKPADFSFKKLRALSSESRRDGEYPPVLFLLPAREYDVEQARSTRIGRIPEKGQHHKFLTKAVWLNNNRLTSIDRLDVFIDSILEYPERLGWLDLSFNRIYTINPVIQQYVNLKILYLHGNRIGNLEEVKKLSVFTHLRTITLHGNPIADKGHYRGYVLLCLPQSYVHVSTAYSNCVHKTIEEKFYEPVVTGENLLKLVECLDPDTIREITPKLLKGNPNTYVLTKSIAEEVVKRYVGELPLAVVRPSIVISSFKEPIPGWLDNLYGPTSILLGAAFGLLRALNCDEKAPADIVPVDYVINSLLAAAWDVAKTRKDEVRFTDNRIYNYVSSPQNLITWEKYEALTRKYALQVPSPLIVWHSTFFLIKSRLLWLIYTFLVETIPAHIVDFLARLFGKKPMLVKAYKKIDKFTNAIRFFTTNYWKFNNDNLMALWYKLNDKDKEIYPFDISQMDWEDYFKTYIVGARVYLLKDPLDTLPQGRRKLIILKIAHYTLVSLFVVLLYKLTMFLYSFL